MLAAAPGSRRTSFEKGVASYHAFVDAVVGRQASPDKREQREPGAGCPAWTRIPLKTHRGV